MTVRGIWFYPTCAVAIALPCLLPIIMAGVRAPRWVAGSDLLGVKFDRFQIPEAALGPSGKAEPVDIAGMRGVEALFALGIAGYAVAVVVLLLRRGFT